VNDPKSSARAIPGNATGNVIDIAAGVAHLRAVDPDMAAAIDTVGAPPPRHRPPGFAGLLHIVVQQQLSLHSALAIWRRIEATGATDPRTLASLDDEAMLATGIGRAKLRYARGIATALADGTLDLDTLGTLDDDTAMASLTALKGIGRWTAEIYLLACLGRRDVMPAGDIALQEAMRSIKRLDHRPPPAEMDALCEPWRPWRSVGAMVLWSQYRHVVRPGSWPGN
jgi:DNA-3-methyladenine glycosylase II